MKKSLLRACAAALLVGVSACRSEDISYRELERYRNHIQKTLTFPSRLNLNAASAQVVQKIVRQDLAHLLVGVDWLKTIEYCGENEIDIEEGIRDAIQEKEASFYRERKFFKFAKTILDTFPSLREDETERSWIRTAIRDQARNIETQSELRDLIDVLEFFPNEIKASISYARKSLADRGITALQFEDLLSTPSASAEDSPGFGQPLIDRVRGLTPLTKIAREFDFEYYKTNNPQFSEIPASTLDMLLSELDRGDNSVSLRWVQYNYERLGYAKSDAICKVLQLVPVTGNKAEFIMNLSEAEFIPQQMRGDNQNVLVYAAKTRGVTQRGHIKNGMEYLGDSAASADFLKYSLQALTDRALTLRHGVKSTFSSDEFDEIVHEIAHWASQTQRQIFSADMHHNIAKWILEPRLLSEGRLYRTPTLTDALRAATIVSNAKSSVPTDLAVDILSIIDREYHPMSMLWLSENLRRLYQHNGMDGMNVRNRSLNAILRSAALINRGFDPFLRQMAEHLGQSPENLLVRYCNEGITSDRTLRYLLPRIPESLHMEIIKKSVPRMIRTGAAEALHGALHWSSVIDELFMSNEEYLALVAFSLTTEKHGVYTSKPSYWHAQKALEICEKISPDLAVIDPLIIRSIFNLLEDRGDNILAWLRDKYIQLGEDPTDAERRTLINYGKISLRSIDEIFRNNLTSFGLPSRTPGSAALDYVRTYATSGDEIERLTILMPDMRQRRELLSLGATRLLSLKTESTLRDVQYIVMQHPIDMSPNDWQNLGDRLCMVRNRIGDDSVDSEIIVPSLEDADLAMAAYKKADSSLNNVGLTRFRRIFYALQYNNGNALSDAAWYMSHWELPRTTEIANSFLRALIGRSGTSDSLLRDMINAGHLPSSEVAAEYCKFLLSRSEKSFDDIQAFHEEFAIDPFHTALYCRYASAILEKETTDKNLIRSAARAIDHLRRKRDYRPGSIGMIRGAASLVRNINVSVSAVRSVYKAMHDYAPDSRTWDFWREAYDDRLLILERAPTSRQFAELAILYQFARQEQQPVTREILLKLNSILHSARSSQVIIARLYLQNEPNPGQLLKLGGDLCVETGRLSDAVRFYTALGRPDIAHHAAKRAENTGKVDLLSYLTH